MIRPSLAVDAPVFGDGRLGVLLAFGLQIAAAVLISITHDFHHKVGTVPVITPLTQPSVFRLR